MRHWTLILFLLSLAGCAESDQRAASRARRSALYEPGAPRFEFAAFPDIRDTTVGVSCYLEIPHASLVFVRSGENYVARFEIRLRALGPPDEPPIAEKGWADSVVLGKSEGQKDGIGRVEDRWLPVPPGEFLIEASVEDLSSLKPGTMRRRVVIPPPRAEDAFLLPIRFRDSRAGVPIISFHIPRGDSGISALLPVRNAERIEGRQGVVRLLRFASDTLTARPPYLLNGLVGTVRWNGVDFRRADTLLQRTVQFEPVPLQTIEIPLPAIREGLYEISLSCTPSAPEAEVIRQGRLFAGFPADFPRPVRLRSLLGPMEYLLGEDAFSELTNTEDEAVLRRGFEKIWLKFGRHEEGGKNLIKIFADRVEDANRSFSTFKEGWKTDQGMITIVFGPPAVVDREFKRERWTYASRYVFTFEQVITPRDGDEVENWVLYRDLAFERAWDEELDRWHRGDVF